LRRSTREVEIVVSNGPFQPPGTHTGKKDNRGEGLDALDWCAAVRRGIRQKRDDLGLIFSDHRHTWLGGRQP
jgi:hypothetical protein